MFEIAGNGEAGKVYPLPASLPKSVTLAPRPRPRRPDGFGGGLGVTLPAVPAPCAGAVVGGDGLLPKGLESRWSRGYLSIH